MHYINLFRTKTHRVLTWQGWLLVFLLLFAFLYGFVRTVPAFLSESAPLDGAQLLVVEGYVHDHVIDSAIKIFRKGNYDLLLTSGTVMDLGAYLSGYKSTAEIACAGFIAKGFPRDSLYAVPAFYVQSQRTYHSALAVRNFIDSAALNVHKVNVLSMGAHARRSFFLFKKAFDGTGIELGVISIPGKRYDPARWWASSKGLRTILSEFMAWSYEFLFFSPPKLPQNANPEK